MTAPARPVPGVPPGMFTRPSKVMRAWVWRPLTPGGVAHLCPPQPSAHAFTACWRPLTGEPGPQLALSLPAEKSQRGGDRCTRCIAHNGGVVE